MTQPESSESFFQTVYEVVLQIPRGRVASYGQVARLAGKPGGARMVGWALSVLPSGSKVPWQRVTNRRGEISLAGRHAALQRSLLETEGVLFGPDGRVNLEDFGWSP